MALVERGAEVVGIDRSSALLKIAADRLAGRARFLRADLRDPLPFDDGAFDVVVASLVMHYLEWRPTLREFRRVLARDGRLVISTHHHFMDHTLASATNYFAAYDFSEDWQTGDQVVPMPSGTDLRAMTNSLSAVGSRLEIMDDPEPDAIARELDTDAWTQLTTERRFIFFWRRHGEQVPPRRVPHPNPAGTLRAYGTRRRRAVPCPAKTPTGCVRLPIVGHRGDLRARRRDRGAGRVRDRQQWLRTRRSGTMYGVVVKRPAPRGTRHARARTRGRAAA